MKGCALAVWNPYYRAIGSHPSYGNILMQLDDFVYGRGMYHNKNKVTSADFLKLGHPMAFIGEFLLSIFLAINPERMAELAEENDFETAAPKPCPVGRLEIALNFAIYA